MGTVFRLEERSGTPASTPYAAHLALMCVLALGFGTACTHVYKTETQRALLRTVPTGQPEATGRVSLELKGGLRGNHTLDLMVSRVIARRRPVRREYERHEVRHGVYLTPQGAIVGELSNLFVTAGLGHLMLWDWNFGLPKTVCLTGANEPKHTGGSECKYIEKVRVVEGTDVESGFEDFDSKKTSSGLTGVGLSLKLTRTSRADSAPIEMRARIDAKGRSAVDLRSAVPEGESRVLLEVLASHSRAESATFEAVVVQTNGGFRIDASDAAVSDAREAIRATGQAWEAELARREAAKEEARRRVDAEKHAQRERERQRKIAKICPKGVGSVRDLISTNPYDVKGRCFEFFGQKLQILSRSIGLYSLSPELVYYINFGSNSAPANYYRGHVKGVGAYQYETVRGAVKTVPSLEPTQLPAPVPANAFD